jgi:2,3-dihydro-2,3-dihydroxybenzoate dehydrogenase
MLHTGIHGAVAVVTGAAGGIGSAVVNALAERGARVAAVDLDAEGLEKIVATGDAGGLVITGYPSDVTDTRRLSATIDAIERVVGPIAILVNAAGIMRTAPILDLSDEDWSAVLAVNTTGVFAASRAVARHMLPRRRGCIVTVASNAATAPRMGMAAYCASKAASTMVTKCLGLELARYRIRCNIVSPGSTDTAMLRSLWTDDSGPETTLSGSTDQFRLGIPLGRIATPSDIANAVAFLASDEARHITMHNLCVDGGATLGS